jgi:hypothetical protein
MYMVERLALIHRHLTHRKTDWNTPNMTSLEATLTTVDLDTKDPINVHGTAAQHIEHADADVYGSPVKDIETVALVVDEPKAGFKLAPVILDEVRDDEVLIEMKYSGICEFTPASE